MKLSSALAFALVVAPVGSQTVPCFEQGFGANLGLADDQVAQGNSLGFTFSFGGVGYTQVSISSNGFLWLGSNSASGCCNGDVGQLLSLGPRVAPLWTDLDPSSGGSVHFRALPGRAVITWSQVPEFGASSPLTTQVQLVDDGSIVMFWDSGVTIGSHGTLVGVSPGNGAPDPGALDLSTSLPFDSGANATVYELFQPNTFDLGGAALRLVPNGNGGYVVTRRNDCGFASFAPFGRGCPTPSSVYELFDPGSLDLSGLAFDFTPQSGGGYVVTSCAAGCIDPGFRSGTDLGLGDDAVATNVPLGFAFPYEGGSTTAIDVASNGCVYLVPGAIPGSRCCNGDVALFLAEAASVAVLWLDLDPSTGGAVRTHQPTASSFAVTYDAVPEYGGGNANTAQLQLFADGRFRLAFGTVANARHFCLVGFTPGGGSPDPGSTNLSSAVPFRTGTGGTPLTMFTSTGGPVIGARLDLVVGPAPVTSTAGLLIFGFSSPPAVPLDPLGMPGCSLLVGVDVVRTFAIQGTYSVVGEPVPLQPSLVGAVFFAQGAIVAPGTNPLGVVASNAASLQIGR